MNNKLLGMSNSILFAPATDAAPAGGGVSSPPGTAPANAPAGDNFYSGNPVEKVTVGGKPAEDFTDGGAEETTDKGEEKEDFVDLTKKDDEIVELDDNGNSIEKANEPLKSEVKNPTLKLDPETIAELRKGLAPQPLEKKSEPAKLSPQQLKEILNPVEVSADTLKSFGFENASPEQVTGFQNFANAVVKNAVSIARVMIDQKSKQFESTIAPIAQNMEKAQLDQTKNDFYSANKDLVKYEKIVKLAAAEVNPQKADGSMKTKDEIFKEVAEATRTTLKGYGVVINTPANPGAGGNGNSGKQVPAPNKLSPSGRSGGDTNGQRGKPNDADADIYKR